MSKTKFFSVFFFLTSLLMFAQENLNDYKYILVPSQYVFQKSEDSYQINSLTKFLFNKAGFTAVLNNENLPEDLAKNRCLGLTAQLNKAKGLFSTKMNIDLINCKNEVIYSTKEAVSREKNYKKAYNNVIRKIFKDINDKHYKYTPKEDIEVAKKKDVIKKEITAQEKSEIVKPLIKEIIGLLYAQPVKNGFQLVDSTPKRVYTIQHTSVKDVFILKDRNGILYRQKNDWIAEYYSDNQLVKNKLNIKF